MRLNEKIGLELIGSLYEAAAHPEAWKAFLELLVERSRSEKAIITLHSLHSNAGIVQESVGLEAGAAREYNAYYAARNPVSRAVLELTRRNGSWFGLGRSLIGEHEYRQTEYYNDFGRKHGSYWVATGATIRAQDEVTTLSFVRSEKASALGQDAVDMMGLLMPHLNRVLTIHHTMESIRSAARTFAAATDAVEAAVIAVDGKGEVVLTNRRAEDLLRQSHGLAVRQRRLLAADPREARALDALVRSAADTGAGRGAHPGGCLLVQKRSGSPLQLSVVPFRSSAAVAGTSPCALILIKDPDARPASRATILSALYQLTPAECRLADLLVSGLELDSAAERMRITYGTARFMLKIIFSKTNTHRQPELMRLLLGLPNIKLQNVHETR